jgi:hypothetical protein
MTPREQALNTIAGLAREYGITPEEIQAHLSSPEESVDSKTSVLTRLLSYLGGIFVIAGLGVS